MCELDIWSNISREAHDFYFFTSSEYDNKFLGTITVDWDDDAQKIREKIRQMVPAPPAKIDLKITRMKADRKPVEPGGVSIMMDPEPPYSILHSDNQYTIRRIIDGTPTAYRDDDDGRTNDRFFDLTPLP